MPTQEQVSAFLDEIEEVCRQHGLVISHEDTHGAFVIETFDEEKISWLREAQPAESGG